MLIRIIPRVLYSQNQPKIRLERGLQHLTFYRTEFLINYFLLFSAEKNGPVAICTHPTGVIFGNRMRFFDLLVFRAVKSISFFFSFFVIDIDIVKVTLKVTIFLKPLIGGLVR